MKNLIIILVVVFLASCKTSKVDPKENNQEIVSDEEENTGQKKYEMTGFATQSNSYCGGARPTDDVLREITSPKPLANTEFYIREGKENDIKKKIILSFKTDEEGKFLFKLSPGDYIIIGENRKDKKYYNQVLEKHKTASSSYTAMDTICLNNWLKGGLYQLTITDKKLENISWNIHTGCFFSAPCVQYTGPYPP